MFPGTAAGGDGGRQNAAPNHPHKSPERPRGGKSRRTLIESACTACQRRKSRVSVARSSVYKTKRMCTDFYPSVMEYGKSQLRTGYLSLLKSVLIPSQQPSVFTVPGTTHRMRLQR